MNPALIAGGMSLVGGLLGNKAARDEAARNRAFQAEQSSTAWQRAVKDMELAGLNPALAYSQGPASTPGGSMAGQSDVVSPAVNSAMAAARMKEELASIREARRKTSAEADSAEHDELLKRVTNAYLGVSMKADGKPGADWESPLRKRILAEVDYARYQAQALGYQLPYLKNSAKASENMPWLPYLEQVMKSGGGSLSSAVGGGAAAALLSRKRRFR